MKGVNIVALFDLRCKDCNREFETIIPFAKLKEATCPHCRSNNHERVYKANVKGPMKSRNSQPSIPASGFT